jgi:putative two-component system response regulator
MEIDYKKETDSHFTDCLTGLFNHGFFQIALDHEVERARRYETTFTLALLDIDSFYVYNGRHGHVKGDRILKKISGLIKENIRAVDLAARYAGDVCVLVLINADSYQTLETMERIRQAIARHTNGDVTISIGFASYPEDATDKESLIKKAQEALLQAKIKGKNRTEFFSKEESLDTDENPRILIVDDEPRNLKYLEALLLPFHYDVVKVPNGKEALSVVSKVDIDLILLDVMMPNMNGYEVCRRLKGGESTRLIPIVMVTALNDMEAKIKGIDNGADDFISKPFNKMELLTRVKNLINVKSLNNNLTSLENTLFSLANAVEAKDKYTSGHIWRVSELAVALSKKIGLSEKRIQEVKVGGIIHDLGKIGVPKDILNKPGRLSPEELDIMQNHPDIGYKICLPIKKTLGMALDIVRYHHEKIDGSGYPDGLKGDAIPLGAKIMAVVDIYDALISDRPYRKGMSKERAQEILRQDSAEGKLDSKLAEYLIEIVE